MGRAIGELLGWWVLLLALYTVFISSVGTLELVVGAVGSALGAAGAHAVRRAADARTGRFGRAVAAGAAWPGTLLAETGQLAGAVAATLRGRPRHGGVHRVRLRPDAGGAWASALLSSTPGSCVLDADGPELTVHLLGARPSAVQRAIQAADGPAGAR
ncbi:hypothetical protein ACIQGZ_24110 [Streptomyces sp. NPDC092296]|uniref:hypothetical protein n=1 Tax=Streptomyces sp. NPDC092296 TaxID=3366012 RepID=UPI003818C150